jgi:hypothetical protein
MEREEMRPRWRRGEQGREVAIGIVPPHQGFGRSLDGAARHAFPSKKRRQASRRQAAEARALTGLSMI